MESNNDLKLLESTFELYSKYIHDMCSADRGKIFPVDLFFISNIQRSQFLIQGFLLLIKEKNFFAAAPLIRLHLDNLLHIYAVFLYPKPHELVTNLTKGEKRLKDYVDKDGDKMYDSKVLKKFLDDPENEEFLPLKDVYGETSKFVHYSDKHVASMFSSKKDVEIRLLTKTFDIPESEEINAIKAMVMITKAQMKYLIGWIHTKSNPK